MLVGCICQLRDNRLQKEVIILFGVSVTNEKTSLAVLQPGDDVLKCVPFIISSSARSVTAPFFHFIPVGRDD